VIFISYKSEESAQARAVRTLLEANGIDCWMAPDSIEPGGEYGTQITNAVRTCDALVLLLTEAAQASTYVLSEIDLAVTFKKDIVPLHLDSVELNDAFVFRLSVVQRIEAVGRVEMACQDLVMRLRRISLEQGGSQIEPEDLVAPVVMPEGTVDALSLEQTPVVVTLDEDTEELPPRLQSILSARFHLIVGGALFAAFVVIAQFDPEATWAITYITLFGSMFEVVVALVLGLRHAIVSAQKQRRKA